MGTTGLLVTRMILICDVTVHLVDQGIDTGNILYQSRIEITEHDNFCTYPIIQTGQAVDLLKKAIIDISINNVTIQPSNLPWQLWSYPTI